MRRPAKRLAPAPRGRAGAGLAASLVAPLAGPLAAARAALGAAAIGVVASVTACQDRGADGYFGTTSRPHAGEDEATFYLNNATEPEYLDPGKTNDNASSALIVQLFEGLTAYDPKDLHPTQGAADRWDRSEDGRRYRFHLRAGAKWSDGAPVTARDFEYAWRRVLRPKTAARSAPNLYVLKNGELFNRGRLKVASADLPLCPEPRPCGEGAPVLAKGAAARLLDDPAPPAKGGGDKARYVRVERFSGAPFSPRPAPPPSSAGPPQAGYVEASGLVEDAEVLGVRAADDLTLDVELEQPTPYFLDLTSAPTLFPVRRDVIERFKDQEDLWVRPENIVVNGPYTLDTWKFRYEITMKRNPFYRDRDKLRVRRIAWLEVEDSRSTMNLYKAGEIDFLGPNSSLPAEYMDLLSTKKDFRRFPYLSTYWYEFNTKKPPVDDARVRWALNLAVNKRELASRVTRSGQIPATHYVPDYTGSGYAAQGEADRAAGVDPFSAPEVAFNPARARALLAEAGYKVLKEGDGYRAEGFPPLEILYNTNEGNRNIAIAIQGMWREHLGVAATLRNEEFKVMLKNVRDGQFQVVRSSQSASYDHPQAFLSTFLSYSPENRTGWADKEYDALVKKALEATDAAEGVRLYRAAEARAVQGMSRLPLYFYTKSTLVKPWVKGYYGTTRNAFLARSVWIDPDWQKGAPDEPAYPALELPPPGRLEGP